MQQANNELQTRMPQKRQNRPFRDFVWRYQGVFLVVCFILSIPFFPLKMPLAVVILFFVGIIGAWGFPRGPGYQYPRYIARWIRKRLGFAYKGEDSRPVFPQRIVDFKLFGSVFNPQTKYYTVYVQVGKFRPASDDPEDFDEANSNLQTALTSAVDQTIYDIGFGFIAGERPYNPTKWAKDVDDNLVHPDFKIPQTELAALRYKDRGKFLEKLKEILNGPPGSVPFTREDSLSIRYGSHGERWDNVAEDRSSYIRVAYFRVKEDPEWRNIAANPDKYNPESLRESALYRVFSTVQERVLGAGFASAKLLSYSETRDFVFHMHDVHTVLEADKKGLPTCADENLRSDGKSVAWPTGNVRAKKKVLETDGNYHAIFRTRRPGRDYVLPGGMTDLLIGNPTWTMSVFNARTKSSRIDSFLIRRRGWLRKSFSDMFHSGGSEELRRRTEELEDSLDLDELWQSKSKSIRWNRADMVSSTSPDGLKKAISDFEARRRGQGPHILERVTDVFLEDVFAQFLGAGRH